MTNVFISWSGDQSKQIAQILRNWIPSVLQFARPYYTPNDIEKGAKWSGEISKKLSESDVGIICLTKTNFEKPWILFEAGALSKDLENSKVCSVLFGMDNADLSGPLTTFQSTLFEKSDFKKMIATINDAGGEMALEQDVFDNVFEMWWPKLESSIASILATENGGAKGDLRSDRDILEEVLALTRSSSRSAGTTSRQAFSIPNEVLGDLILASEKIVDAAKRDSDFYIAADRLVRAAGFLINNNSVSDSGSIRAINRVLLEMEEVIPF